MLQFNKTAFSFLFLLVSIFSFGQDCNITIHGKVYDEQDGMGIPEVRVVIKETGVSTYSDYNGHYHFDGICQGNYHVSFHHISYTEKSAYFSFEKDSLWDISLLLNTGIINEVNLIGEQNKSHLQALESVKKDKIEVDENLTQSITSISGVSSINNGSSISKPVIHGMWGNRISIINNGITQSGQQWGSDHAPEIDPFIAEEITVLKGSSALAYNGSNLGGVVLINTAPSPSDPHLHGGAHYAIQSNGWGHTANLKLEKSGNWISWRALGTIKYSGDRKSPNYYLTNTGNRESNFALSFFKEINHKWKNELYYSYFNTQIGILRGSHISSSTDLEQALEQDQPFYTKESFSYDIEAPQQKVTHHLIKLKSKYQIKEQLLFKFQYGGQLNKRNEFDVRRGGRSEIPSLSLSQWSHFLEGVLSQFKSNIENHIGLQYNYIDNTNDNETTGRLPLIPDYRSHQSALFAYSQRKWNRWSLEYGMRFNLRILEALPITRTLPREVIRKEHQFGDYNFSTVGSFQWRPTLSSTLDVGWVQRQPEINELYSSGLHQGLASIEYGNPNLIAEQSFKTMYSMQYKNLKNFMVNIDLFYQHINNYIFLAPTGEFETTISGSFPVFEYQQANARITGSDLQILYYVNHWQTSVAFSFLRGDNLSESTPLVYMPANNIFAKVAYTWSTEKWKHTQLGLNGKWVAQQNHLDPEQDFIPAPDGYFLLGANFTTTKELGKNELLIKIRIDNVLNNVYRDYLNRLRFFADETGINLQLGVTYKF